MTDLGKPWTFLEIVREVIGIHLDDALPDIRLTAIYRQRSGPYGHPVGTLFYDDWTPLQGEGDDDVVWHFDDYYGETAAEYIRRHRDVFRAITAEQRRYRRKP